MENVQAIAQRRAGASECQDTQVERGPIRNSKKTNEIEDPPAMNDIGECGSS